MIRQKAGTQDVHRPNATNMTEKAIQSPTAVAAARS